jgi:hypothetical protein
MSCNSLANVTKGLIHRMIPLNVGADLGWRCMWYSFLLKGKCALRPFLSVLVIKCLTHHFDLIYNCEYELRVK